MNRFSNLFAVECVSKQLISALMVLLCVALPVEANIQADYAGTVVGAVTDWQGCRERIADPVSRSHPGLDARELRLFNWNIQKIKSEQALSDLNRIAAHSDLVLIQEAAFRDDLLDHLPNARHWSFAPGYRSRAELTGVMTLSASKPVVSCSLRNSEPWLGTPKATSITRFALKNSDATLVVVNVHSINFSFGTREFTQQLQQIAAVLAEHEGPIIFSGDFNTWRKKRIDILGQVTEGLDLHSVEFSNDSRKRAFGKTLDHVYVRGLSLAHAVAHPVTSSDHNPMSVYLNL